MNQYAEYVSPGHPDRLADAIAEGIVTAAVDQRPESLVGVEVAVHRDAVFIDGRIATGSDRIDVESIVRDVYRSAGYGGRWIPDPENLRITSDLCEEELPLEEVDIRPFSDDQNIVIGYACRNKATNYLPTAHWVAWDLGKRLHGFITHRNDCRDLFGPDFKVLVSLDVDQFFGSISWNRLILSVLHAPGLQSEEQHRILLPLIECVLSDNEINGIPGLHSTFEPSKLILNGAGEFAIGGPEGDNGLSGKKLVIDHYGPSVPIGGGALAGKDPHKVDKCGALRARQLAKDIVRSGIDEATVTLGWAPGGDVPFIVEAVTNHGGVRIQLPREELPSDKWFSIEGIVHELELTNRDWRSDLSSGYFANKQHPWEWR
jgi:S-adenosylmethionine synthetase